MTKYKKFRKDDWSDEEYVSSQNRPKKQKKFDRALRTKDIDYLSDYDEDEEY